MKDNEWLRLLEYVTGLVNQELFLQKSIWRAAVFEVRGDAGSAERVAADLCSENAGGAAKRRARLLQGSV